MSKFIHDIYKKTMFLIIDGFELRKSILKSLLDGHQNKFLQDKKQFFLLLEQKSS